ncbi:GNAT family acetyltransferase [Fictibacillus arsenicus]|uniref:GNAT family acetyltransferase n=1 Tax=Fictibacillus arsenicus TaxID=255247 RepID=A0A1V3GAL3_9BACL|nr:GNAT family acetyltransferase [Fictibacillus arsenicus]OOE13899.1 GNAT family acetyltransferase [Fictibacillus arsenicus]
MEYIKIKNIDDPLFVQFYSLMKEIFPKEEVLDFELWREPLIDPSIRMFVAVDEGKVVGATEYRYYPDMNIAMTDFTLIGQEGKGIGIFLAKNRLEDLNRLAAEHGKKIRGMFAEIYNPYKVEAIPFGGVSAMNPYVRREVLSHMGYQKLNFSYVHPSWLDDGGAVTGLDLCFLPFDSEITSLNGGFIAEFLSTYYSVLENKPAEWLKMIHILQDKEKIELVAI